MFRSIRPIENICLRQNRISYMKHYELNSKGERVSITQELRRVWLSEEEQYIKKCNEPVLIVCGEFSSTDTAQRALQKGFSVKVVCGAHMYDEKSIEKVAALKETYKDKFEVYVYEKGDAQKPPYHSVLIGRNLFFENKHDKKRDDPEGTSYDVAKVVENADSIAIKQYKERFYWYVNESKELVDVKQIEQMPVLEIHSNVPSCNISKNT